eukprot:CAMPEP_0173380922 /NCGR_PEP_ID=MMETSP1356-20130122/3479_1 /TAXON_ID=77927 ORGANISM="Hemiselmis virescens, Strain PCC157" /NCGR_SAMPLE_ID=MMETSP1356 /ASSEMBLY_ACC=CAM_ASM_000847 /LENGTH=122 /DNA_ID=CAMNT_0014334645 /DNA_START=123 /DNA_END=491 /DNA_ORIENTATION=-
MVKFSPVFLKSGLPFLTFMVLGTLGLANLLEPGVKERERRKTYVAPEKPEDVLKRMQKNMNNQDYEIVPVPGSKKQDFTTMGREELLAELTNLRESEVWTGIPMKKQKKDIKLALKALPRGS